MKIVNKYVMREMTPNYFVGLSFFTALLLVNQVFLMVKYVVEKNIPFDKVSQLFIYTIPLTLAQTIPMAVLMASILTFGRFSTDSEVIALRSSGISLMKIIRPNIYFGIILFGISLLFFDTVLPWGNTRYVITKKQIFVRDPLADFEERQVIRLGSKHFRYERQNKKTKMMYEIYITDAIGDVTFAKRGKFIEKTIQNDKMLLRFKLYEVSSQNIDRQNKERLINTYSPMILQTFIERNPKLSHFSSSPRTMTIGELNRKIRKREKGRLNGIKHVENQLKVKKKELDLRKRELQKYKKKNPKEFMPRMRHRKVNRGPKYLRKYVPIRTPEVYPGHGYHLDWTKLGNDSETEWKKYIHFDWRKMRLQYSPIKRRIYKRKKYPELDIFTKHYGPLPHANPLVNKRLSHLRRTKRKIQKKYPGRKRRISRRIRRNKPPINRRQRHVKRKPVRRRHNRYRGPITRNRRTNRLKRPVRRRRIRRVRQRKRLKNRQYYETRVRAARGRCSSLKVRLKSLKKKKYVSPGDIYELHKKISIPFACLIFTIIGAPLGMFSRRSGKGMGFGYGIIVVIVYYFMLLLGQGWVSNRTLGPVFAAWMPDLFLGVIGIMLIYKKLTE